jgi:methionyl-tRNA formyltransferase
MTLRLIFMGTPDFAVPTLIEIASRGYDIAAVYAREPKRAGRGLALRPSPVEREARRLSIPVLTPASLRTPEAVRNFRDHGANAAVVVAFGLLLPAAILGAVSLGCFNVHASLLPRWRGAAPINRAIMAGDDETGVTVMRMNEGLDTGPIAMAKRVAIGPDMTAGDLHDELARRGADLMVHALAALERGTLQLTPQPNTGVSYAKKVENSETHIDWTRSWQEVHNQCRGLSPFPGAWCHLAGGEAPIRIKVLRTTRGEGQGMPGEVLDGNLTVACGRGAVRLLQLQRAGRQPMSADEFLRGRPLAPGTRFG